jgi:hypothetical protein
VQHLRLTHPELDFWIDVRLREFGGKWLAVADLAEAPDIGTSEDSIEAVRDALMALGPRLAGELAASIDSGGQRW